MSPSLPPTSPHTSIIRRFFVLSFALSLLCGETAFGYADTYKITSPEDFISFSDNMDEDTQGATVYLAADLDFTFLSDQFTPIGTNGLPFKGTLDGQGHAISNLNLTSSDSDYFGLFGHSMGATIKNVTMDGSCSVTSSYVKSDSNFYVGGIVGFCYACTIENVVNMASVAFTGDVEDFGIGGISGGISSSSTIRNCVNYGSITFSGLTGGLTIIGGIVGYCRGISSTSTIQNCANYGTFTNSGTLRSLYKGGIVGYVHYETNSVIENCLSSGKYIDTTQGSTLINYNMSVVGYISSSTASSATPSTNITHCLWTGDVGYNYGAYGYRGSSATVTVTNSTLATLDTTTMDGLNEYAEEKSWDKWFMLHLMGGTINNLPQDTLIVTQKHFPVPVKEGYTFWNWYLDDEYDEPYNPNIVSIASITDLYAGYALNKYVVTFDFGNRTTKTRNVTYGMKYGTLPEAGERAGWTFIGWFTGVDGSGDEITSETTMNVADDHALYAHWTINNYTLTFILNNGESDIVKTLNYSDPIYYQNDPVREGYRFDGWSLKPDTMPAHNLNITAQWTKIYTNITEYVEIVFDKKDLSEDDVKTIIRKYTGDDNFVIAQFIPGEEVKVIIKFADEGKAQNFVEIISTSSNAKNNYITRVDFTSETTGSFSSLYYPNYLFSIAF